MLTFATKLSWVILVRCISVSRSPRFFQVFAAHEQRPSGSAGAAASEGRVDGERAPPGGSAEARASTMVVRDDGKRSAMSREQVAKSRSEANRVTGTVGTRVAS